MNKLEKIKNNINKLSLELEQLNKLINNKNNEWIPYKDFLKQLNLTPKTIHERVCSGEWFDGFVIKKEGIFYKYGCIEHYKKWLSFKNYKRVLK